MEELLTQAKEILNRLVKEFDKSGEACAYRDSKAQETQEEVYKLEHYPADYTEEQAAKIYEAHEEAMEILHAAPGNRRRFCQSRSKNTGSHPGN